MPSHIKTVCCADCGVEMQVSSNKRKASYCSECRMRRYTDNLLSLVQKAGEPYEKCLRAQRRYYQQREQGGGVEKIPPKPDPSV